MNFKYININDIIIKKSVKNSLDILYNDSYLQFNSPILHSSFGIDHKYNDYFLNLQLRNYDKCSELQEFLMFIKNIEKKIIEDLNLNNEKLNSQYRINNNYDPIIYTKFIYKNSKCLTTIKKGEEFLSLFNLGKNFDCKGTFVIDKIWFFKNKFFYKIKIKDLFLV